MRIPPNRIRKTGDDRPVESLFRYVWRMSGGHQIGICALALLVAGLSMAPLELQRRIIDGALEGRDIDLLIVLGVIFVGVLLLNMVLKFSLRMYQGWLTESAIRYCRDHLLDIHRRRQDGQASEESGQSGRAVAIISSEIDQLGGFVGEGFSAPAVNGGMLLAVLGYMVAVEPGIALLGVCLLLPQVLVTPLMQRRINRLVEKKLEHVRHLSDSVGEDQGQRDGREHIERIYDARMRIFVVKYAMKGALNLLNGLAPLTVLVVGGMMVIDGDTTVGTVVAFVTGFDRLGNPLRELLNYYRVAAQAGVQHRMIARWM